MNEDFLLDELEGKATDIIAHGEKISDGIGNVKTIQTGLLANQLQGLNLVFREDVIASLDSISQCIAIPGVEVSKEEMEAITEATKAKAEVDNMGSELQNEIMDKFQGGIGGLVRQATERAQK